MPRPLCTGGRGSFPGTGSSGAPHPGRPRLQTVGDSLGSPPNVCTDERESEAGNARFHPQAGTPRGSVPFVAYPGITRRPVVATAPASDRRSRPTSGPCIKSLAAQAQILTAPGLILSTILEIAAVIRGARSGLMVSHGLRSWATATSRKPDSARASTTARARSPPDNTNSIFQGRPASLPMIRINRLIPDTSAVRNTLGRANPTDVRSS